MILMIMMMIGCDFESTQAIDLNKGQLYQSDRSLSISYNRKTLEIQLKMWNSENNVRIKTCRPESDRFDKFSLSIRP